MNSPLLTAREAAEYLRMSLSHFYRIRHLIPCERPGGPNGFARYRRSDLDAYSRSTRSTVAA